MAKKGQKYRKHSPEFKLSVIMDMRENHLGIMETERKYDVKHDVISKWERIFLEEGAEGLMKERRGRASKVDGIAGVTDFTGMFRGSSSSSSSSESW